MVDTAAANVVPEQPGAVAITPHQPAERDTVVVVDLPPGAVAPETTAARPTRAGLRDIHVAANLHELVAATPLTAPEEDALARERRDLNEVVHGVLIIGLTISTTLMLAGVGLALFYGRDLPTTVPDVGDVIGRVFALRPSGFVALGLLVLIATPILRVVGSIGAFLGAVANLGAQAIQRTRLYEAFQTIAHDLNASLDLKQVLTTLLLQSVAELNVKAGSIRLLGPRQATLHLAAAYGLSASYLEKGTVEVAHSPIDQRVLREQDPLAITELTAEAGLQYPVEAQREGIRSVLVLPLCAHSTAIGVLRLYSGQVRRFGAEEIAFATAVANLGAVAIENARLHAALQSRMDALKEDSNGWFRFLALS